MDDQNQKFSRRSFLGGGFALGLGSLTSPPFEKLLQLMSEGLIQQAHAEATGTLGSRNYVNVLLAGAPGRYSFDHWMATNAGESMITNPMVATALVNSGGRAVGTQYKTFSYKNVLVPHMFSHQVFNGKGALRPLTDLLDNMLVIRGYGTKLDGHPFNVTKQLSPLGGASSISGVAADSSTKTFQAIQWPGRGSYGSFFSSTGKAMNTLGTAKPIHNLLEGFGPVSKDRPKAASLVQRNQEAMELARTRLQSYIKSDSPGAKILSQNMSHATDLMKKGINDLDGYWNEALTRYQNLILNSMRMANLPGISDMSLTPDGSAQWNIHVAEGNRALAPQGDLRSYLATRTLPGYIAEGFALAEYVLKQGLATSVELFVDSQGTLKLNEGNGDQVFSVINDMHGTGAASAVLTTTTLYRGVAAAILELADQLKATQVDGTNLWSETVVQITSDFGRSAQTTGNGSDHGFNQMVTSVYSGIIDTPIVVGNILRGGINSDYAGTQGLAAAIDGYNQSGEPTPLMAASTVTQLLRVPKNPYQNLAAPLVEVKNGKVAPLKIGKMVNNT